MHGINQNMPFQNPLMYRCTVHTQVQVYPASVREEPAKRRLTNDQIRKAVIIHIGQ